MPLTGPSAFTGAANGTAVGTVNWTNPSNALDDNNVYATVILPDGTISHNLNLTFPTLTIPAGATINGIVIDLDRKANFNVGGLGVTRRIVDSQILLRKGGSGIGVNRADASTAWPTTETRKTYGTPTDIASWGSSWSATDFGSGFGVQIAAICEDDVSTGVTASIDYAQVTVYFTPAQTKKTCTARARIELRSTQTVTARARMEFRTSQTVTARARMELRSTQTVTARARMELRTIQTFTARARISVLTLQTITAKARIEVRTAQTIQARARVEQLTTQLVTARARVEQYTTQTINARAHIETLATQLVTARARVEQQTTQTLDARVRVEQLTAQLITARAHIENFTLQTLDARARVEQLTTRLIIARARVEKLTAQTLDARAHLLSVAERTVQARAKLLAITTHALNARAYIVNDGRTYYDVRARAKILKGPQTYSLPCYYEIQRSDHQQLMRVTYSIGHAQGTAQSIKARARIVFQASLGLPCMFEVRQVYSQGNVKTVDFSTSTRSERIISTKVRIVN